jgi:uncharacterized protein (DUF433 family)
MKAKHEEQQRIEVNPDILMGKPVIAGTRIPVYLILNLLASGYTQERILEAYPGLALEDIRAALQYAEQRMRFEEVYPLPASTVPA